MLPYCLSDRLPPDCLFVLAEADWRMYSSDLLAEEAMPGHVSLDVHQGAFEAAARAGGCVSQPPPPPPGERDAVGRIVIPPPPPVGTAAASSSSGGGAGVSSGGGGAAASSSSGAAVLTPAPGAGPQNAPTAEPGAGGVPGLGTRGAEPSQAPVEERSFAGWSRTFPEMPISEELEDLVKLMTLASRLEASGGRPGRGHFMWLSYNAARSCGRKQQPSYGSHLVAFDKVFALAFLRELEGSAAGHIDHLLRAFLRRAHQEVGASFLFPACGSCESHESTCQKGAGVRETSFGSPWVGEGFREPGAVERYIGVWPAEPGAGGPPTWIAGPLNFDMPGLEWRTALPPLRWDAREYRAELWARWWLDWNLNWTGPKAPKGFEWVKPLQPWTVGRPEPGAGSRGRQRPWTQADSEREAGQRLLLLIADPNGRNRYGEDSYSPISRVAEQLVCDGEGFHQQILAGLSTRVARERRQAIALYVRRFFVDAREQQVPACAFPGPDSTPMTHLRRPSQAPAAASLARPPRAVRPLSIPSHPNTQAEPGAGPPATPRGPASSSDPMRGGHGLVAAPVLPADARGPRRAVRPAVVQAALLGGAVPPHLGARILRAAGAAEGLAAPRRQADGAEAVRPAGRRASQAPPSEATRSWQLQEKASFDTRACHLARIAIPASHPVPSALSNWATPLPLVVTPLMHNASAMHRSRFRFCSCCP